MKINMHVNSRKLTLETPVIPEACPEGVVSIVVPCCGQLEFTKLCVPSVLRHSRAPCELVFLDIGSLDGTVDYLAGVMAGASARIEIVRTMTDLTIPMCCEEALRRARGQFILLLNNDTIVTDGWLEQLVGLAGLSSTIGLVGPMSNYALPPQLVEHVPYRLGSRGRSSDNGVSIYTPEEVAAVDKFACEWRDKNHGSWMEVDHLGGFCLLIKRQVLEQIGTLQGTTGLNVFDTDALCQRARQAGFMLACCRDLFIHNFGSRSFGQGTCWIR
jgi:GT2 family glycosyltransferase